MDETIVLSDVGLLHQVVVHSYVDDEVVTSLIDHFKYDVDFRQLGKTPLDLVLEQNPIIMDIALVLFLKSATEDHLELLQDAEFINEFQKHPQVCDLSDEKIGKLVNRKADVKHNPELLSKIDAAINIIAELANDKFSELSVSKSAHTLFAHEQSPSQAVTTQTSSSSLLHDTNENKDGGLLSLLRKMRISK